MSKSGVWDLDIAGSGSGSGSEIDNRLKTLEETIHKYEIYHLITEGTTGSVEKPTHGDIIMDQYPAGGDCIIVKTDSTTQKPIEALVYDASGVLVEGTLDINGNYTLSGVPTIYPVALVFQVSLAAMYKTLELSNDRILTEMQIPNAGITSHEDLSNINQAGTGVLNGHISDQAQTIAGDKTYSGTAMFNEAVTFKGDIIQQGTGKITYTEDVRTKNDLITLRDGTITGLDIGEYTGLKAKLYDGVNDGLFVIDRDGYFKVGDEGNLVTLTGREDSPIDQAFGYWDDTTKIFKTKTISSSDLTDNSSIVKTSGTQTIEGAKTFSDTIVGSISGNADTATLATQALAIKPLGNSITLPATPTSVTKIIKIATVSFSYSGTININCSGFNIRDETKMYINSAEITASGIRVIYGKNNVNYGIKKIIVTRETTEWSSDRNIYAEIVTRPNYNSTTILGVVETNTGTFTPSMTEVSSVEWTVVDSLSLDYERGDISSYQHVFTKNIIGNLTGNADTATKLANARKINGVSFDGSADITVADSTKAPLASPAFTGNPTINGGTVWHSGNDGAGSGLDADLVRGLSIVESNTQGLIFGTDINKPTHQYGGNNQTFLTVNCRYDGTWTRKNESQSATVFVLNKTSGNIEMRYAPAGTGPIVWTVSKVWNEANDGSGSGLDADLLDGQHGSYYAPASALAAKANLESPAFTGNPTVNGYPVGTPSFNISNDTQIIDSVPIGGRVLYRRITEYDENPIVITPPVDCNIEGLTSLNLYGQYSFVELERISSTAFAIKDMRDQALATNIKSLLNNIYWREGVSRGYSPGIIRSGLIPSKVVVIGNSMTAHGYDATIWPLTDRREMAASKPNSGWVSLLQQHLYTINPDIKVYKTNGASWEVATLGARSYEDIHDQIIDEVKLDRPYPTSLLLDDVLDSNVDVIIVQLAENCADVTTKENIAALITDYENLYASLRERSPNATIYQMSSFWVTTGKLKAMTAAARDSGVEFVNELAFLQHNVIQDRFYPMSYYEAQTGDPIYDEAGEVAFTVSATVAGHPNDKGFAIRAAHAIFALYNSGSDMSNSVNRLHIYGDLTEGLPLRFSGEYLEPLLGSITDVTTFGNAYNTLLDRYLSPGFYAVALDYPSTGPLHGLLEVRLRSPWSGLYSPTEQVFHAFNTSGKLIRNTSLSADDMVWTEWSVLN